MHPPPPSLCSSNPTQMRPVPALFVALLALVCVCHGVPAEPFSQHAAQLAQRMLSLRGPDGSWATAKDTFHAVGVLNALNRLQDVQKAPVCKSLKSFVASVASVSELADITRTAALLKCGDVGLPQGSVPAAAARVLKRAKKAPLTSLLSALIVVRDLQAVEAANIDGLADVITERTEDTGTFHNVPGDHPTAHHAGTAFAAIALLHDLGALPDAQDTLEALLEGVEDVFVTGESDGSSSFHFVPAPGSPASALQATVAVVNGVFSIARHLDSVAVGSAALQPVLSSLQSAAAYILTSMRPASMQPVDAYYGVLGLQTLATNAIARPLVVAPRVSQLSTSASRDQVQVRVTDVLGQPVGPLRVYLKKAVRVGASASADPLTEHQSFAPVNADDEAANTEYTFNLLALKPSPGSYKLHLRVLPTNEDAQHPYKEVPSVVRQVNIVTEAAIIGASVTVSPSDSVEHPRAKVSEVAYPSTGASLSPEYFHHLFYALRIQNRASGKSMLAQQVHVRFEPKDGGESVTLATSLTGKLYKLHVNLEDAAAVFGHRSGTYAVRVIVGDANVMNPIAWHMHDVVLTFLQEQQEEDSPWTVPPPITHVFRPDATSPPAIVSLVFTGLVLSPIAIVVIMVPAVGMNFGALPKDSSTLFTLIFLGSIVCAALVLFGYFLFLNMFQTVYLLAAIVCVALVSGHRALRARIRVTAAHKDD